MHLQSPSPDICHRGDHQAQIAFPASAADPRLYPMRLPGAGSLAMTTRVDLRAVMEFAGGNLIRNLDERNRSLPNFHVIPKVDGVTVIERLWHSHNLGRWFDALLRLEAVTGFRIPATAEQAMLGHLTRYFDNPEHLCLCPLPEAHPNPAWRKYDLLDLHSLREGLLALTALQRYRQNAWAGETAKAMCASLLRLTREDGSWDMDRFPAQRIRQEDWGSGAWSWGEATVLTNGRLIEALVWHYQLTGETDALRAADRFARQHISRTVAADGSIRLTPGDHTHSYFGTLRGLLLFGELTAQRKYTDRIVATYAQTVRKLVKRSGFVSHDLGTEHQPETTSPGDAAQLALWLGLRHQHTEYLDDVERIVRARLVPSQITDLPAGQSEANLLYGAMGGMQTGSHHGKIATVDITAAVVHSLLDVYQHSAVCNGTDLRIHFHFDYSDENVRITSQRGRSAKVVIEPVAKSQVWIRIPRWAPIDSLRLLVAGRPTPLQLVGDYAFIPRELQPALIELSYGLPIAEEVEHSNGVDYRLTWRGDEVMGISPNNDFLPFYPDACPAV